MWYGSDGNNIEVYALAEDRRTLITQYEPPEFESTVYAESSTCDDEGYCGSTVVLNDTELDSWRGVNILVFDRDGRFSSYAWYDTHGNDAYRSPAMSLDGSGHPTLGPEQTCTDCAQTYARNHLQTIPEGSYIVIVGDDQPGQVMPSLEAEYERMGAEFSYDDTLEYRDSWILVSQKTTNAATDEYELVFERHAPRGSQSGVGKVTAYFFAPHEE
jgi:hypothetical protein